MTTIRNIRKGDNYDQDGKDNDDDQEYKKNVTVIIKHIRKGDNHNQAHKKM